MNVTVLQPKATMNTTVVNKSGLLLVAVREGARQGELWGISVSGS